VDTLSYKTLMANKASAQQEWFVIDADGLTVGRLASRVALILRGKHKPCFTPHAECGDKVIIVNAEKVVFLGNKMDDKQYIRYTGYPGGQRFATPRQLLSRKPERILEHAIKGMLPKGRLGRTVYGNLYVYAGPTHKHEAQTPKPLEYNNI
jgi:large subunit ribosomal protein L13